MGERRETEKTRETKEDLLLTLNTLEARARALSQQIVLLEERIGELTLLSQSIEKISKEKPGSETFAGIGRDVFAKMKLSEPGSFLVNIGAKVFVKKSADEAKSLVSKWQARLAEAREKLRGELTSTLTEARSVESKLYKK